MRKITFSLVSLLLTTILIVSITGVSTAILGRYSLMIRNLANIKAIGIEVYEDSNLTKPLAFIAWGMLEPGENKTFEAWFYNPGNVPMNLSMVTLNWNVTKGTELNASKYISLSWNREGLIMYPEEKIMASFTLHISLTIEGIRESRFDIQVIGDEVTPQP